MPVDDGGGNEERVICGHCGHVNVIIMQVEPGVYLCTPSHIQHIHCVCIKDKPISFWGV